MISSDPDVSFFERMGYRSHREAMRRTISKSLFTISLGISAGMARRPFWSPLTRLWMRGLATLTLTAKNAKPQTTLEGVAQEWQRMFPSRKMVPIKEVTATTVLAEITAACPLRGTGDVGACHRMMEYDRRILESIGGSLVVLKSQAEPGILRCEVAIRRSDETLS